MKRAYQERQRTLAVWRRHLAGHDNTTTLCACEFQAGRFRKGQRVGGCGKARCHVCHGDKLMAVPTRARRRSDLCWREYQQETRRTDQ